MGSQSRSEYFFFILPFRKRSKTEYYLPRLRKTGDANDRILPNCLFSTGHFFGVIISNCASFLISN